METALVNLVYLAVLLEWIGSLLIELVRFLGQILVLVNRLIFRFENNRLILVLSSIFIFSDLSSMMRLINLVDVDLLKVLFVKIIDLIALRLALDLLRFLFDQGQWLIGNGRLKLLLDLISFEPLHLVIDLVKLRIEFVKDHEPGSRRLDVLAFHPVEGVAGLLRICDRDFY
jgi:hypothetical protein